MRIDPRNVTAQLQYEAAGNPPSTRGDQAISNCFPGLEFDFRNAWRRIFQGITLHEANNLVVAADPPHEDLVGHQLLVVAGQAIVVEVVGPARAGGEDQHLVQGWNPAGVWAIEWSNALAHVVHARAGQAVTCLFTRQATTVPAAVPADLSQLRSVDLVVRPFFASSETTQRPVPVVEESLVEPGELTQSLCSPWQNDYRECACYYWAASRPDYVNVELEADGTSSGNNWLAKDRQPRRYTTADDRLLDYDELFQDWEGPLRFVVEGTDQG